MQDHDANVWNEAIKLEIKLLELECFNSWAHVKAFDSYKFAF